MCSLCYLVCYCSEQIYFVAKLKSNSRLERLCCHLERKVPREGLEPSRKQILSLLCLPVASSGLKNKKPADIHCLVRELEGRTSYGTLASAG